MTRTRGSALLLVAVVAVTNGPPFGSTPPAEPKPVLEERVDVRELRVVVTSYPRSGDPAECAGLAPGDFVLTVDGTRVPVRAVVPVQGALEPGPPDGAAPPPGSTPDDPARLQLVVVIDEYHHSCAFCRGRMTCCGGQVPADGSPVKRHAVYESARRMLRETIRPGDRVMIVSFAYWPRAVTPWLDDPAAALGALDALEQGMRWVGPERAFSHVRHWYDGMRSLFLALGQVRGTKDVLLPTCHLGLGADDAVSMRELAAAAQRNDVVLHTIDVELCSMVPGGPLGCVGAPAIGPVARSLGGRAFGVAQGTAGAVDTVRRFAACRVALHAAAPPTRRDRLGHSIRVDVLRPGFSATVPEAAQDPVRAATLQDVREALFLVPDLRRGWDLSGALWPRHPVSDPRPSRPRWSALAIASLQSLGEDPAADRASAMTVDLVLTGPRRKVTSRRFRLDAEAVTALRAAAGTRIFAFPVEIEAGHWEVSLIATETDGPGRAVTRWTTDVPDPPARGGARPALLVSGSVRVNGSVVPLPAMSSAFTPDRPPGALVLDCTSRGVVGDFVARDAPVRIALDVERVVLDTGEIPGCRWLIGRTALRLAPGEWRFEPAAPDLTALRFAIGGD